MLQIQSDSSIVDITLRRLQYFHPSVGQVVNWSVTNANNQIVKHGSFTRTSGPITVKGVSIYKAGSTLSLTTSNCLRIENPAQISSEILTVAKVGEDYEVSVNLNQQSNVEVRVVDILGRIFSNRMIAMQEGSNKFSLALHPGTYILQVRAEGFSESKKLVF